MGIIAGIQGQPAELLDGAKVNSLTEYTTGNGINFGHQLYATGSLSGVAGLDQAVTLTNKSSRFQVVTLTAARTYTLPSTGIKAGDTFTFINRATVDSYRLNLNSSGGNAVDWIVNGKITVIALQDTPTTAGHWMTTDANTNPISFVTVVSSGSGTITSYVSSGSYVRNGKVITFTGAIAITNNGTGAGSGKFYLPFTCDPSGASSSSRIAGTTGNTVSIVINSSNNYADVWFGTSYPWATNATMSFSIVYIMA
jgi:hypothetical protein